MSDKKLLDACYKVTSIFVGFNSVMYNQESECNCESTSAFDLHRCKAYIPDATPILEELELVNAPDIFKETLIWITTDLKNNLLDEDGEQIDDNSFSILYKEFKEKFLKLRSIVNKFEETLQ